MKTIKIKETVKLPSRALELMVEGLLKQSQREDFVIDMGTYGSTGNDFGHNAHQCFGCAATCTIQAIAHKDLKPGEIDDSYDRAKVLGFIADEMMNFEYAMNLARVGDTLSLFRFFDIELDTESLEYNHRVKLIIPMYNLQSENWELQIPMVNAHIEYLKSQGY